MRKASYQRSLSSNRNRGSHALCSSDTLPCSKGFSSFLLEPIARIDLPLEFVPVSLCGLPCCAATARQVLSCRFPFPSPCRNRYLSARNQLENVSTNGSVGQGILSTTGFRTMGVWINEEKKRDEFELFFVS
jgi:hypothetical protein